MSGKSFWENDWWRIGIYVAVFVDTMALAALAVVAILDVYGIVSGLFSVRSYIIYTGCGAGFNLLAMILLLILISWWNARRYTEHNLTLKTYDFAIQAFVVWGVCCFAFVLLAQVIGIGYEETYLDPYVSAEELCEHMRITLFEQGLVPGDNCPAISAAYSAWQVTSADTQLLALQDMSEFYGSRALDQATRIDWWILNLLVIILGALLTLYFAERFYKRVSASYLGFTEQWNWAGQKARQKAAGAAAK